MQKIFKQQILQQNVQMDGSVNFNVNGDITMIPCPWENEKEVTNGERVRFRAGVEVDADGRTRVKRYNDGKNGPKLETLYETAHAKVQMTRPQYRRKADGYHKAGLRRRMDEEFVYVTFKFPKKYPLWMIMEHLEQEQNQVMSYFSTRKEETIWNQQ